MSNGDAIKNIEFTEFEKIVETGYWHITILVNDTYYISFSETKFGKKLDGSGYYSREIWYLKDEKKVSNIKNIKIKYIEDWFMITERDHNKISGDVYKVDSGKIKWPYRTGQEVADGKYVIINAKENIDNGMQAMAVAPVDKNGQVDYSEVVIAYVRLNIAL